MARKYFITVFLVVLFSYINCAKLPPYFSRCSSIDPKFNECVAYNIDGGLHAFVKGDKMYNIESLLPIFIPKVTLQLHKTLKLNISNAIIGELDGAKIKNVSSNLEEKFIEMTLFIPKATLIGQYHIHGIVHILPINERGPVNITMINNHVKYYFDYELEEKKEKFYVNITNSSLEYQSESGSFMFYDLFNHNKFLSDLVISAMNRNWRTACSEISPAISDVLNKMITKSLRGFFEKVPYDELFE